MPLFDDEGWVEYLRTFGDEPEEKGAATDRALLSEFLENIGLHPQDNTTLIMIYLSSASADEVASTLHCRTKQVEEKYQHAVDDARRRALLLINLEYVKQQPYIVRLFLRHLFMW